ncbi:MAG: hypothetical protein QG599_2857 [Pseudomonadota bacterium]|nr:hypothetical protein [Pseudomonadota bacterium]
MNNLGETAVSASASDYLILDLGKQKKKKIKKMRKGQGALMGEVQEALTNLRTNGALEANARPVVVIVREKPKKKKKFSLF